MAAEAPERFLQATQWIAQITRTVNDNGSAGVDGGEWTWTLNSRAQVVFRMAKLPNAPSAPVWQGVETLSYSGSGQETLRQIYQNGSVIAQGTPGSKAPAPALGLTIDVVAGTFDLGLGALTMPWEGTIDYSGAFQIPQSDGIFYSGATSGSIQGALPATGMVLQGRETYSLNTPPIVHGSIGVTPVYVAGLGGGQIQIDWTIQPQIEELELAVDIAGYEDWLPEGNFRDQSKRGNTLSVTAKVQGTNGAPTTAKATWIRFELLGVSKEPGVCLNSPLRAAAKTDPDYKFELEKNPFPLLRFSEEKVETIGGEYASATAVISSFDFGGWCRIKVTAEVNGQLLTGYLTTDTEKAWPEIRIPRRQENSHVADAWLEAEGATGMEDATDDENTPAGDGHNGDGFSLYEEYRGFAQNGRILRTKAKKKDLMVLNTVGGPGAAAAQLFKTMSKLEVHHTFRPAEFSSDATKDNWLNFNHSSHHVVDQHGLRFVLDSRDQGFAAANNRDGFGGNSTPGSKSEITVPPSFNAAAARNGRAAAGRYAAASYAHELGHGCALYHHGDGDPGKVTWTPIDGAAGQVWFENGGLILPRNEAGQALVARPLSVDTNGVATYPTVEVIVARQQGQHSGDTQCAMRYDIADAYIYPAGSNVRYGKTDAEVIGRALCTSAIGTGVNAPGRSPQPRYGNATTKRGNCAGQLCVNDKYVRDTTHIR